MKLAKLTVEERQQQIKLLSAKKKEKTITREENFLLSELRETERRRKKDIYFSKKRKALEQAKKEALLKILEKNGFTTENALKNVLRFVEEHSPQLMPLHHDHDGETDQSLQEFFSGLNDA